MTNEIRHVFTHEGPVSPRAARSGYKSRRRAPRRRVGEFARRRVGGGLPARAPEVGLCVCARCVGCDDDIQQRRERPSVRLHTSCDERLPAIREHDADTGLEGSGQGAQGLSSSTATGSCTPRCDGPYPCAEVARGLLCAALVVVLSAAGCSESDQSAEGETTTTMSDGEARALGYRPSLSPGTYVTKNFTPTFTFRVETENWFADEPNERWAGMGDLKKQAFLDFFRPKFVLVPTDQKNEVVAPADLLDWLARHPNLEPDARSRVVVGEVMGNALDVTVTSIPRRSQCDEPCVALFRLAGGFYNPYHLEKGDRARFVQLEVRGERVLIAIEARADDISAWLDEAERVLETVKWIQ